MKGWTDAAASRLRIRAREWGTQDQLVDRTGIPKPTLQRILAGKVPPGDERFALIIAAIGAAADEILRGDEASARYLEVGVYDVEVAAGAGRVSLEPEDAVGTWPFPRDWVQQHFGLSPNLRVVRVAGDSQEPELRDGALVLVDLKQNRLRDGMHVVRLGDQLMIKRVQVEGATVRLRSRNPAYDDVLVSVTAEQDQFQVIGRAGGAVTLL